MFSRRTISSGLETGNSHCGTMVEERVIRSPTHGILSWRQRTAGSGLIKSILNEFLTILLGF